MEELNSTYIQALIDADGFDYWLQECQDLDPDCETQFDMALVQWGQYGLRNFGLRSESAKYDNFFFISFSFFFFFKKNK